MANIAFFISTVQKERKGETDREAMAAFCGFSERPAILNRRLYGDDSEEMRLFAQTKFMRMYFCLLSGWNSEFLSVSINIGVYTSTFCLWPMRAYRFFFTVRLLLFSLFVVRFLFYIECLTGFAASVCLWVSARTLLDPKFLFGMKFICICLHIGTHKKLREYAWMVRLSKHPRALVLSLTCFE